MDPFTPKHTKKDGPEARIQKRIIDELRKMEWYVLSTHGNEYQSGFPDLYAVHALHGYRWIEVKNPLAYRFTKAQMEVFHIWSAKNIGIWVLVDSTPEELRKLFAPANWYQYLSIAKVT